MQRGGAVSAQRCANARPVQGLKSKGIDPQSEAEACFLKTIEIAQRQRVKSLELRAAASFARLLQHQGKQKEDHTMLAEIDDWFAEGLDTKDLHEAKALLDELT